MLAMGMGQGDQQAVGTGRRADDRGGGSGRIIPQRRKAGNQARRAQSARREAGKVTPPMYLPGVDSVKYAAITGWGKCLPPAVLSNADLEKLFDTSDEWIVSRTGIK